MVFAPLLLPVHAIMCCTVDISHLCLGTIIVVGMLNDAQKSKVNLVNMQTIFVSAKEYMENAATKNEDVACSEQKSS